METWLTSPGCVCQRRSVFFLNIHGNFKAKLKECADAGRKEKKRTDVVNMCKSGMTVMSMCESGLIVTEESQ